MLRAISSMAFFAGMLMVDFLMAQGPDLTPHNSRIKRGSIDDISAIGARSVGGWNKYSLATEADLGTKLAGQFEKTVDFVSDGRVQQYVDNVAQQLVRNSDAHLAFTVKVVTSSGQNAFTFPGGFLYVDSGLLLSIDNEAELAAAIAHAIAHAAARHETRMMTRMQFANMMTRMQFANGPSLHLTPWIGPESAR